MRCRLSTSPAARSWVRPWTFMQPWEYACHEGNNAIGAILPLDQIEKTP
jgi:hypothetical protein